MKITIYNDLEYKRTILSENNIIKLEMLKYKDGRTYKRDTVKGTYKYVGLSKIRTVI